MNSECSQGIEHFLKSKIYISFSEGLLQLTHFFVELPEVITKISKYQCKLCFIIYRFQKCAVYSG